MNKENQSKIIELVRQTKPLIFQEMTHEKVTEKGAADYVTNVDVAAVSYTHLDVYKRQIILQANSRKVKIAQILITCNIYINSLFFTDTVNFFI